MPKYQLTIVEIITSPDPASYPVKTTIYDQTLERLDVAKVVISANECISKTQHCEVADENEPEPDYDAPKPLSPMENLLRNDEHNAR